MKSGPIQQHTKIILRLLPFKQTGQKIFKEIRELSLKTGLIIIVIFFKK